MDRLVPLLRFLPLFGLLPLAPDTWATQIICDHSPENPTVVLGLLSAGAAGYPYLRGLLKGICGAAPAERRP